VAQDKPTVFITGDLSFFYDSNALWNNYIPKDFRIIIVNNQGGGIFRIGSYLGIRIPIILIPILKPIII